MKHLIRTSTLLAMFTALLTVGLVAPGSAATVTGVKGVVTLDGKPIKGVTAELHYTGDDGYESKIIDTDTTNSKGAYSFRVTTKVDEYVGHTVVYRDPQGRAVAAARAFTGRTGKTVTRNATLKPAASITGSLKRGDSRASSLLRVDVFGPQDFLNQFGETDLSYEPVVRVATDGSFTLKGLPAGEYRLGFVDDYQTYFPQCYDSVNPGSKDCGDEASGSTAIKAATAQKVTLKPQTLTTKGLRVSGTVTDTSGRALKGVSVVAQRPTGGTRAGDSSSKAGSFRLGPLAGGSYRLKASASYPWAGQTGPVFDLTGQDSTGVAVKLKSQAKVTTTPTPGTGNVKVVVGVTRAASGSKVSGSVTIRWGSISKTVPVVNGRAAGKISGLPKGPRRITVLYAGTSSTAATTVSFTTTVK